MVMKEVRYLWIFKHLEHYDLFFFPLQCFLSYKNPDNYRLLNQLELIELIVEIDNSVTKSKILLILMIEDAGQTDTKDEILM